MDEEVQILAYGNLVCVTEQFWNRNQRMDKENCESHGNKKHLSGSCAPVTKENNTKQEACGQGQSNSYYNVQDSGRQVLLHLLLTKALSAK